MRKVHGKESNIRADVRESETLVELYAVNNGQIVVQQIEMLQSQIAVAIANAILLDSRVEQRAIVVEEAQVPAFQLGALGGGKKLRHHGARLLKVLSDVGANGGDQPKRLRAVIASGLRVKPGQSL